MQRLSYSLRLWIGAFLATAALAVSRCEAQYASGNNGLGTTPMEPLQTNGSSVTMPGTRPPTEPTSPTRPESWPGAAPVATSGIRQISRSEIPPADQLQFPSSSRCLAMVGGEPVLESDIIGVVNRILEENKDRIPPEQFASIRETVIKAQLKGYIQNKQIYFDAKQSIPAESWTSVEKQLIKAFDETELDRLMKQEGVTNRRELEAKLRKVGSSLEREKRMFMERELATQWVQQQIKRDEEITYDQMIRYYHQHQNEFNKSAKAKWEEIAVRIAKYPTAADAKNAIAQLGNQVVLGGAAFAEVAKKSSDGATASSGGRWDWTTKGSFNAKEVDKALFTLPVGQLSPILQTDTDFRIVRVTDREEAGTLPFLDAQVQIREKIIVQRFEKQKNEYLAKIAARITATTIFDHPAATTPVTPATPFSTAVPQMSAFPQPPLQ